MVQFGVKMMEAIIFFIAMESLVEDVFWMWREDQFSSQHRPPGIVLWIGRATMVLVAFSIREALELPTELQDRLRQLHFNFPDSIRHLTTPQPPLLTRFRLPGRRPPLMVEICSGSGSLSAAFRDRGFPTMAIDRPGNDHRLLHSFVPLDLASSQSGAFDGSLE